MPFGKFKINLLKIKKAEDLINFFQTRNISNKRIPAHKIFHSLIRQDHETTILEVNFSKTYELFYHYINECKDYGSDPSDSAKIFHFFDGGYDSIDELIEKKDTLIYLGFCIFRPDWSISYSLISEKIIIREKDHYAFLVNKITSKTEIVKGLSVSVSGFPYIEKDNGIVMCAQAVLATIADYWNNKENRQIFSVTTASAISLEAGVLTEEIKPDSRRGLTIQEINNCLKKMNIPFKTQNYFTLTQEMIKSARPETNIYGFFESGWPILCIVKAGKQFHAISVIGHTFDRNNWLAMADIGYYHRPLSGDGQYHSNMAWIRNFIIHDDNFGPYLFIPWEKFAEILVAYVVILPSSSIKITPLQSERIAYIALKEFAKLYRNLLDTNEIKGDDILWARQFCEHTSNLVLRPLFIKTSDLLKRYANHEFFSTVKRIIEQQNKLEWLSIVEISWPEIYCYQRMKIGLVVINPDSNEVLMIHLPKCLIVRNDNYYLTDKHDPIRAHEAPAGN
ncbi:MAG: hypothetical protein COS94_03380 [Candidatus Hydrogenedentes bacterium CG07_land_8_20_14_0_80_42_17]|nr:MAG: hypothetical protein COS94_03380 [Candidatus Hydrogenedentes bacterium CG07_land_8_20_14_0_80_42_17]